MPRAKESTAGASTAQAQQDAVSEGIDNFELPRSLVMKLARASQVRLASDAFDAFSSLGMGDSDLIGVIGSGEHEILQR